MAKDTFVRSVTVQDTEGVRFNGEIWKKSDGAPDESTTRNEEIRLEGGRKLIPHGDREDEWKEEADPKSIFKELVKGQ